MAAFAERNSLGGSERLPMAQKFSGKMDGRLGRLAVLSDKLRGAV